MSHCSMLTDQGSLEFDVSPGSYGANMADHILTQLTRALLLSFVLL